MDVILLNCGMIYLTFYVVGGRDRGSRSGMNPTGLCDIDSQ